MKDELYIKQKRAIDALLKHSTIKDAAIASNTSKRTLERWLTQPEFQKALSEAQLEVHQTTIREMTGLELEAVKAIKDILERPNQPGANIKFKAATKILDYGKKNYAQTMLLNDLVKEMQINIEPQLEQSIDMKVAKAILPILRILKNSSKLSDHVVDRQDYKSSKPEYPELSRDQDHHPRKPNKKEVLAPKKPAKSSLIIDKESDEKQKQISVEDEYKTILPQENLSSEIQTIDHEQFLSDVLKWEPQNYEIIVKILEENRRKGY